MSGTEAFDKMRGLLDRYGFPTVVAIACFYMIRQDVVLPLVSEHTRFLDELTKTQVEIGQAIQEQTRLLYMLQPRTAAIRMQDDIPQN